MSEASEIRLEAWQEFVGIFRGIAKDEFRIAVLFNDSRVIFNPESHEAKIVEKRLNGGFIGQRIAILKTDISERPLLIRFEVDGREEEI
jgi:hypothetical protein